MAECERERERERERRKEREREGGVNGVKGSRYRLKAKFPSLIK